MRLNHRLSEIAYCFFFFLVISVLLFASCTTVIKAPKGRPFQGENSFEVKGGNFTKAEKTALISRLSNQLDDSAVSNISDLLFIFHRIKQPPAYDTGYSAISAQNMKASMFHIGYYNANVTYRPDTILEKKIFHRERHYVKVHYTIDAGKQTRVDTMSYRLRRPDLQELALKYKDDRILLENSPISKSAVLGEISRLVDTFRNNGYYKFTSAELKLRGDTTIAALTSVSDDPFEQLQLLAEAQQKRDSPEIRLAMVLTNPEDTTRFNQYRINKIYILQDYRPGDNFFDTGSITQRATRNFILRYHKQYVRTGFLSRNFTLLPGQIFRQDEYYNTLSNLSKTGVWDNVNIRVNEIPDSNKVDLIAELIPTKKFGFEAALEGSYSATSNTNNAIAGNLFGISGNLSLVNRNIGREAIRMTHSFRAGIELNNNSRTNTARLVNSNELSYRNSVVIPKITFPLNKVVRGPFQVAESFVNSGLSFSNRLDLFNLQNFNLNYGSTWMGKKDFVKKKERKFTWRLINAEFSYLFNQTDSFRQILINKPFLNYSYNTAFVIGMSAGYSSVFRNPRHLLSQSKERSLKLNLEESGLTWGALPFLVKYKKKFVKLDAEYTYTVNYAKTAVAFRLFGGVGIPIKNDTTLPFFKQFFGGGSNSMRGWPVRGLGLGSQQLTGTKNEFNNRTGDMRLEGNVEYRYDIARIIPNSLTLRGALFVDAGNIWNIRNSNPMGGRDSAQFKLKNLYRELGVSAGTGFRLDFNYFILRLDLGFRFKRPELSHINNGWKAPSLSFNDFLPKLFGRREEYKQWRYENFNFTIGISYPF